MDQITSYFAQQGVLGIVIVMLIGVVIWQQRRLDSKDKSIGDLQDKRKLEADAFTDIYVATTKEMVGTQKDSLNAINLLQRSVEALAEALRVVGSQGKK